MTTSFHFTQKDFVRWLKEFALHLQVPAPGNLLILPPELGKGSIFAMAQGRDMSCIVMDFTLNSDFTFVRKATSDYGILLFFNQVTVGDFFRLRSGNEVIDETTKSRSNIFMSSTDMELEINYSKGTRLQRVGIYFSPNMVRKFVPESMRMNLHWYTKKG
ncbi:MAG TPA: hypothetical protein VLD19_14620, partial [Chitinophagaceae bacterium]|nr:hypothetical protein [Chitinophagaceae bacterium]